MNKYNNNTFSVQKIYQILYKFIKYKLLIIIIIYYNKLKIYG